MKARTALLQHDAARKLRGGQEGGPDFNPECQRHRHRRNQHGRRGGAKHAPASANRQNQRDDQGELRLVTQQTKRIPATMGRASSNARAKANSAAVRNPFWPWVRFTKTAGNPSASSSQSRSFARYGARALAQQQPQAAQIQQQRRNLPENQSGNIRQFRQGGGDQEKIGRIVPAIKLRLFAE